MLPNEKFALECRERYAEDGLVVDQSNGEFAHCPLPKGLGETGYYLLHDDHQWQGLLQSRDVGRRCYWIANVKKWLSEVNFVDGWFDLWDIFEEFNSGVHNGSYGKTQSEETRRKKSESHKGEKNYMFGRTGELHPMYGVRGELHYMFGRKRPDISERMSGERHPMFGTKRPEHSERMTGELNPMFGKTHTEDDKRKISATSKGRRWWNDGKGNTKFVRECPGEGWKLGRK